MNNKTFYIYIMASKSGTLYVGMTNNIKRRVLEHKNHLIPGFTDKYSVDRLLYVETFANPASAINREKQIKAWRREKKVSLIDLINPQWNDLSQDWYGQNTPCIRTIQRPVSPESSCFISFPNIVYMVSTYSF